MTIRVQAPYDPTSDSIDGTEGTLFIVFYASIIDGKMWCPDCRVVEDLVKQTLGGADHSAVIIYVGDKPSWKSPTSPFRGEPWRLRAVPTIVKIKDGQEVGRLVDREDILKGLSTFVP